MGYSSGRNSSSLNTPPEVLASAPYRLHAGHHYVGIAARRPMTGSHGVWQKVPLTLIRGLIRSSYRNVEMSKVIILRDC